MAAAQRHGLLLGRNADTAAGLDNVLALAPPLSLTDEDVDHIVEAMTAAFSEVATEGGEGGGRLEAARGEGR
jgi:adenosylmethionine-8-amino-7-oxononanoate aminotransferase